MSSKQLCFRRAATADMDWAYQLFKSCLQDYISATWGWDELFQRHSFADNIPASEFMIVSLDGQDVGGYSLKRKNDQLILEMLLITPACQNRGLGQQVMGHILDQSRKAQLPLRLSVLRTNPAYAFYHRLGFVTENEDQYRYRMVYAAGDTIRQPDSE